MVAKPPSIPSTEQARKRLTVAQLKTILKSVHLSVDGLKADLLKRLESHLSNDDDDDDDSKKTTKTTKTTKTSKKEVDQPRRRRRRRRITTAKRRKKKTKAL